MTFDLDVIDLTIGIPGGIGFSIDTGSLGLSIVLPKLPTIGIDTRRWFSIEGLLGDLDFPGLPGFSLSDLGDLLPEVNLALGDFDPDGLGALPSLPAVAFDWSLALDLPGGLPTFGDLLSIGGFDFDLPTAMIRARGTANLNLFDFVTGEISYAFEQKTVDVDADGDGTFAPGFVPASPPARGPPDLAGANLTTFEFGVIGSGLSIGVPDGPRFSISAGTVALAVITPSAADMAAGDGRNWLAVTSDIATASLTGIDGFAAYGSDLTLRLNRAGGVYQPSGAAIAADELNWLTSVDVNPAAPGFTGGGVMVESTPIEFTDFTFEAGGTLGVDVGSGFVVAAGTFVLTVIEAASGAFAGERALKLTVLEPRLLRRRRRVADRHGERHGRRWRRPRSAFRSRAAT